MSTSRQIARSKQRAQGEVQNPRTVLVLSCAIEPRRAARCPGALPGAGPTVKACGRWRGSVTTVPTRDLMRYGFGTLGLTSSFLTPCARDMRKAPTRSGRCFDVRGLSRAPGHLCWRSAPSRAPRDSGWSCASRRPLGLALCDGDSALCVDAGRRHRESAVTTVQSTSPEFLRI